MTADERYLSVLRQWEQWSLSYDTNGPWVPSPGDLTWLFLEYIPGLRKRLSELRDFQTLYETTTQPVPPAPRRR